MFPYREACHISRFVPFRFIGHVVVDHFTVYPQVLEADILYFPFFVISGNDG